MTQASHPVTLAVQPEPTDHSSGADHARVTVVEYGDFECPICKTAATTPKLLLERYPGKIRFLFRHFPLEEAHPHAYLAVLDETAELKGMVLAERLRDAGLRVECQSGGGRKAQLKRADRCGARFALMLGEQEMKTDSVAVKDLRRVQEQTQVSQSELVGYLKQKIGGEIN